jgi:glycosyltransferase involved in cell wall biosynthesis
MIGMPKPRISVVTPSYNRIRFLRTAMDSVLDQAYPDLEYVLVDGGSKDGSAALIAGYGDRLRWWASEPDAGQYDAINKGFAHTSGEVMAWLNSDDRYLPGALAVVGEIFAAHPHVEWLTTAFPLIWDAEDRIVSCGYRAGYSRKAFQRGEYIPNGTSYFSGYIQQESTFWRRSLWERCGGSLDTTYRAAADFDLWMRFSQHAELFAVEAPLGGFRAHGDQRTVTEAEVYAAEARRSLQAHGGKPYSAIESLAYRWFAARVPRRARQWAVRAGVAARRPACVYRQAGGGWLIEER